MKTKIYLCSFASPDLSLSVKRFINQARNTNFYEDVKVFGIKDLSKKLNNRISYFLKHGGKYLYGYQSWHHEIVDGYLNSLPENSILQYSDLGCHFNKNGIERFKEYISMTEKNNMTVFQYYEPPEELKKLNYRFQKYMEYEYTKGDVIKYFGLNFNSKEINSPQIWDGTFFMKKSPFVYKFLKHWEEASSHDELLDFSESKSKNHEKFVAIRGDQSIFSIICKLNNVHTLSVSECEWAESDKGREWSHLSNYPILAKRDLKFNIFRRFFNRQKKGLKRLIKKFR